MLYFHGLLLFLISQGEKKAQNGLFYEKNLQL